MPPNFRDLHSSFNQKLSILYARLVAYVGRTDMVRRFNSNQLAARISFVSDWCSRNRCYEKECLRDPLLKLCDVELFYGEWPFVLFIIRAHNELLFVETDIVYVDENRSYVAVVHRLYLKLLTMQCIRELLVGFDLLLLTRCSTPSCAAEYRSSGSSFQKCVFLNVTDILCCHCTVDI